ncbi:MAG: hypothetical protein M3O70_25230 [Actinomycetota bacterium]|nr:hypothetical protein [Actinomycetota bacterium]
MLQTGGPPLGGDAAGNSVIAASTTSPRGLLLRRVGWLVHQRKALYKDRRDGEVVACLLLSSWRW